MIEMSGFTVSSQRALSDWIGAWITAHLVLLIGIQVQYESTRFSGEGQSPWGGDSPVLACIFLHSCLYYEICTTMDREFIAYISVH